MKEEDPNKDLKDELNKVKSEIKIINERNRLKKEIRKSKLDKKLIKLGLKKGENGK